MPTCPRCGADIGEYAAYCMTCGHRLGAEKTAGRKIDHSLWANRAGGIDDVPGWLGWLAIPLSIMVPFGILIYALWAYRRGCKEGVGCEPILDPYQNFGWRVAGWCAALLVPVLGLYAVVHVPTLCHKQGLRVGARMGAAPTGFSSWPALGGAVALVMAALLGPVVVGIVVAANSANTPSTSRETSLLGDPASKASSTAPGFTPVPLPTLLPPRIHEATMAMRDLRDVAYDMLIWCQEIAESESVTRGFGDICGDVPPMGFGSSLPDDLSFAGVDLWPVRYRMLDETVLDLCGTWETNVSPGEELPWALVVLAELDPLWPPEKAQGSVPPTQQATLEEVDYLDELIWISGGVSASLDRVASLTGDPRPTDSNWVANLEVETSFWGFLAEEAKGIVPPRKFAEHHALLVQSLSQLDEAGHLFRASVENMDPDLWRQGIAKMEEAGATLEEAGKMWTELVGE